MSLLKTYTISTDITAGEVNVSKLSQEISDSGDVNGFTGLHETGDSLHLMGTSFADEAACDATVLAHVMVSLPEYKVNRNEVIDGRTDELILEGFTYDSQTFSITVQAQINWNSIRAHQARMTFPLDISTLDHDEYSLAEANVDAFWDAYEAALWGHLNSGRALKLSINAAADEAAVDAITDTR